jgi:hypothetical protein
MWVVGKVVHHEWVICFSFYAREGKLYPNRLVGDIPHFARAVYEFSGLLYPRVQEVVFD